MEEIGEGVADAGEGEGKGEGEDPGEVGEEESKEEADVDEVVEAAEVPPARIRWGNLKFQPETRGRSEQDKDDNCRSQSKAGD